MPDQTTNLALPILAAAQAQKHVTLNQSLQRLDALVQTAVKSRSIAAEPASPPDGALWTTPPGKVGPTWDAFADEGLAYYRDGAWEKLDPRPGWRVWIEDERRFVVFDGKAWIEPTTAFPNLFRNPCFDVWQRGTTLAGLSSGSYGPDGAYVFAVAGFTVGLSRQSVDAADRDLIASPYFCRWSLTGTGSGAAAVLALPIENVRRLAGRTVTVAFKLKASAAINLDLIARQEFGSGGSSGASTTETAAFAATTSWQLLSATIDLPSVEDKTIGDGSYTNIRLQTNGQTAAIDIDLAEVQVIPAPYAPPFVLPDEAESLMRCRRYYEAKTVRSENGARHIPLAPKRVAPTVTVGVGSAANVTTDGFELSHSAAADCAVTASAELV